jgi:ribosome-binding protein aMBF1 (putative translation factor)
MSHVTELTNFGLHVVERRWKLCMQQKDLATELEKKQSYINRIEKGKSYINYETMIRIAEALHTEVWRLTKPWKNPEKKIAWMKAVIKKYHGRLPPFVKKKMEEKK